MIVTVSESLNQEIRRLQYLEALGVDSYVSRQVLPGALPSVVFDWPEASVVPLQNMSNAALADKNTLQKLQQDLGVPQHKAPAAKKTVNVSASNAVPVKVSSTTAGVMQFQLAIFQPDRELLALVPAQHTDGVHLQLLKNILLAIAVKSNSLVPVDNFIWPPRVMGAAKTNVNLDAAQETLHSLLEGYQLKSGARNVLVFAGVLAEKLFPLEIRTAQSLAKLNVLLLPELQQMLEDSQYKKITWQKIRSLNP